MRVGAAVGDEAEIGKELQRGYRDGGRQLDIDINTGGRDPASVPGSSAIG
jgi:hypothetical protein